MTYKKTEETFTLNVYHVMEVGPDGTKIQVEISGCL